MEFYSLEPILKENAQYNIIIGERSNGKTYAVLAYMLEHYWYKKEKSAYIRRWKEDYRGKRGGQLFAGHSEYISQLTKGEWDQVSYYSGKWYLARMDKELNKIVKDEVAFCYAFAINDMEHDKSASYPDVTTIAFDEFLTRQYYLKDEFVLFSNVISTIVRYRDNVKIFMMGNTVNKYCPYFKEMGLKHVGDMKPGTIEVVKFGKKGKLRVAVERCKSTNEKSKKSNVYFAFDNPALEMIKGGAWEIDIHPHLTMEYTKRDIMFSYFIDFDDQLLQAEIVTTQGCTFTYIHRKTSPIKNPDRDLIFSLQYDPRPNWIRNIRKPTSDIAQKISYFFRAEKVFYQDNEVGEIVRNYLIACLKEI